MYHAVDERPDGRSQELMPAMRPALFEWQLRHLGRHYRLVRAPDLPAAVAARRRGERYPVALTFDDDLRCHVAVTLPILQRADATATFFLTGASLDEPFSFWWERLGRALDLGVANVAELIGVPAGTTTSDNDLVLFVQRLGEEARTAVEARLADVAGADPPDAGLRAADVVSLVEAGMDVGFHTLRHHNLTLLPDDALASAMEEGREALEEVTGVPLQTFCYPYGFVDDRVADAACAAGFVAGFTCEQVAVATADHPLLIGRVGASVGAAGIFAAQLVVALFRGRV
jgi:peptidoglycan/xylan/chitin deacetylase (PgdA/CDA1 family)